MHSVKQDSVLVLCDLVRRGTREGGEERANCRPSSQWPGTTRTDISSGQRRVERKQMPLAVASWASFRGCSCAECAVRRGDIP